MMLFDDMYEHEVWNDTDERRVVLLLHIKRPERFPGSLVRDAFLAVARHSPYIQDPRRNIEAWRRKVTKRRSVPGLPEFRGSEPS